MLRPTFPHVIDSEGRGNLGGLKRCFGSGPVDGGMVCKICAPFFRLNFDRLALLCRSRITENLQRSANGVILKVEDCTNTPFEGEGAKQPEPGSPDANTPPQHDEGAGACDGDEFVGPDIQVRGCTRGWWEGNLYCARVR